MNSSQHRPDSAVESDSDLIYPDPQWIFEKDMVERVRRPAPPRPLARVASEPAAPAMDEAEDDDRPLPFVPRRFKFGTPLAEDDVPRRHPEAPARAPSASRVSYIIVAVAAVLAGGGAGFFGSQAGPLFHSDAPQTVTKPASLADTQFLEDIAPETATAQNASETVLTKKAIPMATLKVSDAAGEANRQIPLALSAEPAAAGQDLILKISGVPEGAYLTAGRKAADNTWELPHQTAGKVSLVSTSPEDRSIDLTVAGFVPSTGEMVTPIKEFKVQIGDGGPSIQPASAPPDTAVLKPAAPVPAVQPAAASLVPQPIVATAPQPQPVLVSAAAMPTSTSSLIQDGDQRLAQGDIVNARKAYGQAFALGSIAGAMGMARTYDPDVISALGSPGSMSDRSLAIDWYRKALAAGDLSAEVQIKRLKAGS